MGNINVYEAARMVALQLLSLEPKSEKKTADLLEKILEETLHVPAFADLERDKLRRMLEADVNIYVALPVILEDNYDHIPWLEEKKSQISWGFWSRYKQYLLLKWPSPSVESIEQTSDEILSRIEDPSILDRPFLRRGMVVGQVQSGKTANYTGLICKAVDAGYKIIIVLAGNHNNLRSQTQMRLDEEFLGYDTAQFTKGGGRIGVGILPGSGNLRVIALTTRDEDGDLSKIIASKVAVQTAADPLLLVIKKNVTVLRTVLKYFLNSPIAKEDSIAGRKVIDDLPMLMIDDEADLASINTADIPVDENGKILDDYKPTRINELIRRILVSFRKRAYIGYTATPFANIFIDPDVKDKELGPDLFPESFIINLPTPSDYIGPTVVFGLQHDEAPPMPLIKYVDDYASFLPNKHKKEYVPKDIPESLKKAINSFIISCAIRRIRGQESAHNSMLIHVTRFTAVQSILFDLVAEEVRSIKDRMKYGDGAAKPSIQDELEDIWRTDFLPVSKELKAWNKDEEWGNIKRQLLPSIDRIKIKKINGTSEDILDYRDNLKTGLSVIAIGGDKLSRGLTLEGLTISYYLRATRLYDTLMQMGRWFGYRPGYLDLCRIYLTRELSDWFQHITLASEELRAEFDYMHSRIPPMTPRDYGLRVQSHPVLMVTSRVKMRTSREIQISYSRDLSQTRLFNTSKENVKKNYLNTDSLIAELGADLFEKQGGWYVWKNVPAKVVSGYLREMITHKHADRVNGRYLSDYIEKQQDKNELTRWTIGLRTLIKDQSKEDDYAISVGGQSVVTSRRSPLSYSGNKLDIGTLVSSDDESLDLTKEEKREALRRASAGGNPDETENKTEDLRGAYYRDVRSPGNGLLLIYPLDPNHINKAIATPSERQNRMIKEDPSFNLELPLIGYAVSFPFSPTAKKIPYRVNLIY